MVLHKARIASKKFRSHIDKTVKEHRKAAVLKEERRAKKIEPLYRAEKKIEARERKEAFLKRRREKKFLARKERAIGRAGRKVAKGLFKRF